MFGRQKFDEKSWELLYSLMDQCFPHSFYTELNVKISKCWRHFGSNYLTSFFCCCPPVGSWTGAWREVYTWDNIIWLYNVTDIREYHPWSISASVSFPSTIFSVQAIIVAGYKRSSTWKSILCSDFYAQSCEFNLVVVFGFIYGELQTFIWRELKIIRSSFSSECAW